MTETAMNYISEGYTRGQLAGDDEFPRRGIDWLKRHTNYSRALLAIPALLLWKWRRSLPALARETK